jgi:hypothetical protein
MATFTAITHNVFQAIGLVRPRIEVMVREPADYSEQRPLRMHWVRDFDAEGRKIMRIQWLQTSTNEFNK